MKCDDITDLGDKFVVSINLNKNDYPGQFMIGQLFYDKVKNYMSMRPVDYTNDRFFVQYLNGKCKRQNIGRHTIGGIPKQIATFLNLKDAERYTGHCFRRTAATLLSESGASMQMVKQLGRWRSDIIAQGYIEDSLHNRQMIFDGITQNMSKTVRPLQSVIPSLIPVNIQSSMASTNVVYVPAPNYINSNTSVRLNCSNSKKENSPLSVVHS